MFMSRPSARGLSLVELLVGLAIGLFIIAGALSLFGAQSQRTLDVLLESQLNRNLRLALEVTTQDLRRAGAWENAMAGAPGPTARPVANPHAALVVENGVVRYSYGQDNARSQPSGLNLQNVDEQFGFRLQGGRLEALQGQDRWQAVTDSQAVEITRLEITPRTETTLVGEACRKRCCETVVMPACPQVNAPQGCPRVQRWSFDVRVEGRSRRDPALMRTLQSQVQVRNELMVGSCPA